jgi:hypothetical protein
VANRSYLYSTNVTPGPGMRKAERKLTGISEWTYDIPIVFKLLVSGAPRTCRSNIWDNSDEIAIIGDFAQGVDRLTAFLRRIDLPVAQPLIAEALEFLARDANRNPYFILEAGEVLDMGDDPVPAQNARLLDELLSLGPQVEQALANLSAKRVEQEQPRGLRRLFGARNKPPEAPADPLRSVRALGLGNWRNVLYFHFDDSPATVEADGPPTPSNPGIQAAPEETLHEELVPEQDGDALAEHSDVRRDRAILFTLFAQARNYSVIPGRYGGEFDSDMLALGEKGGQTVLVLGLKALDADGGIQIDTHSLGGHKQLTAEWLDILVSSLGQSEETSHFADAISFARDSGTLALELLYVEPATRTFTTVGIAY